MSRVESFLLLAIALTGLFYSFFLRQDALDPHFLLSQLLSHADREALCPLVLTVQVFLLCALFQSDRLPLVLNLAGPQIKTLSEVLLLVFPALIYALAPTLKVFFLLCQITGDRVPALLVELLSRLDKLLHKFYSSLLALLYFLNQLFSQMDCRRLRMFAGVSCCSYLPLPRNNVLVQFVSLLLTVTYVGNVPVFALHEFSLQLFQLGESITALL